MSNELIRKNYKDIADAIRAKTGEDGLLSAEEMPGKISGSLAKKPEGSLSITVNGTNIDVSEKATVDVSVPSYPEPTGTYYINSNGEYNVKDYALADVSIASISCIGIENDYLASGGDYIIYDQGESQTSSLACHIADGMVYLNSADAITASNVSTPSDVGTNWSYNYGISVDNDGGTLTIKLPCVILVDDLDNINWGFIEGPLYIKLESSTLSDDEAYDWFTNRFSHVKLQTLGFLNPNEGFQRADNDYIMVDASDFYSMVYITITSES